MTIQIRLITVFVFFAAVLLSAQTPKTINYQGFLKDSGGSIVQDGDYTMTFRLYSEITGALSSKVYESTHTVPVRNGIFNVELGENPTFSSQGTDFSRQYWLGVTLGSGDELPLVKINASPYAIHSFSTSSVDGPVIEPENLSAEVKNSLLPVGTVITSVLSLELFRSAAGDSDGIYWVEADGASYPGSRYAELTGSAAVPQLNQNSGQGNQSQSQSNLYYYIKIN